MNSDRRAATLVPDLVPPVQRVVAAFVQWLEDHSPESWDHQSFYAGPVGSRAKALYYRHRLAGTLAVAPMVLLEALLPSGRRLFHKPMRFPIADAHYAAGFTFLGESEGEPKHYLRATQFLEQLLSSRCPGFQDACWGYPFGWVTRDGTIPANTPLITTTPYVYEAFLQAYHVDGQQRWRSVLDSIVRHALTDIKDSRTSARGSASSYTPFDTGKVVNASAYRAFMLMSAHIELGSDKAREVGERNLEFVLESQRSNGSWCYAMGDARDFVDHFHTCFVLKALAKIEQLTGGDRCREAIARGFAFYRTQLFDEVGLPKPFARAPRLTVYRRELYDYAECVNLCLLMRHWHPEANDILERVLRDLLARWIRPDGSFRSRELLTGWDNVPMHRWAQSQMFRSLAFYLREQGPADDSPHRLQRDVPNLRAV